MAAWRALAGLMALGLAAGAGFLVGTQRGEAPQTRLELATCGLVPAPAPLDLPLAALMETAGAPGLTLGPILHPGLDTPLSVVFRPLTPGAEPRPLQHGHTLELPVDTERLPDALRLTCRYGAVARVDYRHGAERTVLPVTLAGTPATPDADPTPDATPDAGPTSDAGPHTDTAPPSVASSLPPRG